MESRVVGESLQLYSSNGMPLRANGVSKRKKTLQWDLNDWKWDGDRFLATPEPFNAGNGLTSSSSGSDEMDVGIAVNGDAQERRTIVQVAQEAENGSLSLSLGGNDYAIAGVAILSNDGEDTNGERNTNKLPSSSSSSAQTCQVEGCTADLNNSKDYHKGHKVCETHAKSSTAIVKNVSQRFCQQCSRFHLLEEFDEGKRSCRRRLAGHNKRRRKACPDNSIGGTLLIDDKSTSYLLLNLLGILSNLHSGLAERSNEQDSLSHFLRSLANLSGSLDNRNLSSLLQASQNPQNVGSTAGPSSAVATALLSNLVHVPESAGVQCSTSHGALRNDIPSPPTLINNSASAPSKADEMINSPGERVHQARLKNFDLNSTYSDVEACGDAHEHDEDNAANCDLVVLDNSRQLSPQHTSGNSDSASGQSLSSSNADAQCRTDRIVFKLFGKDPQDFPVTLRAQILAWLSNSPTDMESYIRPGCIVLTLYLRLSESAWDVLCNNLSSYLSRLFNSSTSDFWKLGWIYATVQDQIAFAKDGQVLLDASLPLAYPGYCEILSVTPIAVAKSAKVNFTVRGSNLTQSAMRILCAFEGQYLTQQPIESLLDGAGVGLHDKELDCLCFSCSLPDAVGRGLIEVEDEGLNNHFFPFIVAEKDVCSEICMLESTIDITTDEDDCEERIRSIENVRNQALNFLNEFGWLLHRSSLLSRCTRAELCLHEFDLGRFNWLVSFAIARDWCAVVKKLLDILFSGSIELGGLSPHNIVQSENMLHMAVRRNCRAMVELLLHYRPDKLPKEASTEKLLFRPDILGPSGLTPLHAAAASSGAEGVLDALTADRDMLGIKAWESAHDDSGFTPEDYARAQGHASYLDLVQKKIDQQLKKGHVVVGIPGNLSPKFEDATKSSKISLEISKNRLGTVPKSSCNLCSWQMMMAHRSFRTRTLSYKPSMLSLVAIAAVCVCVGIMLYTLPFVKGCTPSFRWELLGSGSI